MDAKRIQNLRKNIIETGRLLWEKDLVGGLNGNISARVETDTILLTAHSTCLGRLEEKDILLMKLDGELLEGGSVSTENLLHTEIFKNFPDTQAVIHTHTIYTNAFFLENETFVPRIFESKLYLGEVKSVEQLTPAVTDITPVIEKLKSNNIVPLRNHGIVAMGKEVFDCFLLIQSLEEAVKIDAISRLYQNSHQNGGAQNGGAQNLDLLQNKKYKLFSQEQIDKIVEIINGDAQMKELGEKTKMIMDLAVKLDETGKTYSFCFENGNITKVGNDEDVEFLINADNSLACLRINCASFLR